ncbi:MAG: ABC transporter substrate-binding protein [Chloroflexi bacterium]|nr:ABC transporter substrate-binding protein [Chloroflexota bacterium]
MKKITYILMLAALLLGLSACSQPAGENGNSASIELTDAMGNQVAFQELPSNIVVTGKQTPMIIDLMYLFPAAETKIVGIENRSQTTKNFLESFSPSSAAKIVLEKGAGAEQIAALDSDLVILKTSMAEELGARLQTLGIPTLYVSMESIPELETDITNIGLVLGQPERASEVIGLYNQMTADIQSKIDQTATEKPDVLLLQYSEDNGEISFEVPPATWLQTNLVEMAGGNPVWTDAASTGGWATVNMEQIANWNPDIIFVVNYFGNSEETVSQLMENEVWQQLAATQNGTLYGFPGDFISWDQPDSRWILGYNWMAMKINPDAFADVNFEDVVSNFYQQFYGIDETTIQQNIIPLLYGSF